MTTAETMLQEARRHVFSGSREQINVLAANVSSNATSLQFTYDLKAINDGAIVEIDLEQFIVLSTDAATKTAVVIPAQYGTTTAAHTSGTMVTVNPKFSRFGLFTALNQELAALSSEGLFQVKTVDLTFNPAIDGYDMTSVTNLLDIYSVSYAVPGPSKLWPRIKNYRLQRNASTTDFASGTALILYDGGFPGRTVRVLYRAPFTALTALTDDVATVAGLHVEAHDIPPLGAAAKLVAPRDVKRGVTEQQGDTRRADEVPPGTSMASARGLLQIRDRRVQQEVARLKRFFPPSMVD